MACSATSVCRRKVRSKILRPNADKGKKRAAAAAGSSNGDNITSSNNNDSSGNKRVKTSSADKNLQAAKERAPAPPDCSLSDSELAEIEFKINRSPVMVLWAAVRSNQSQRVVADAVHVSTNVSYETRLPSEGSSPV